MFDPYTDNEAGPYVDNKRTAAFRSTQEQIPWSNSSAPNQWTVPNSPMPVSGRISSPPPASPVPPRRPWSGLRTGAIIALTLVLLIVFGVGLFAGWQFGRSGSSTLEPNAKQLQPGTGAVATIPPLTGNNAVNDVSTLSDALATKNLGETVAVHIYRGSQQLTINVKLGELQAGG
jgi:hypothetical protein